jgi:BirA family biotin operon repressor/biotin-[acetyl-CoA-carboxylase] ligase
MKYAVLQLLKQAAPGYVSGEELGRRFDISRTAIWKYIKELRQEGYVIEAVPRKGYRLLPSEERLNAYEISCGLSTSIIGREVQYFDSLDSTNIYARKLAAEGCSDGMTVVTGRQTAGRGRLGRNWESPADKGIYMSVVLRPTLPPAETQIFTLAAAVAAVNAIKKTTHLHPGIKWPNDLVIEGRKVCGILLEMSSEADRVNYIIIGIGINYSQCEEDFPKELRDRAISLEIAARNPGLDAKKGEKAGSGKVTIIRSILCELDDIVQHILAEKNDRVLEMWRNNSVTLGREVGFKLKDIEYTGTAVGITSDGRLEVACSDGVLRRLLSGEVSVRGIYGYV